MIRFTLTGFELEPIEQPGPMIGFDSASRSGICSPCETRSNLTFDGEPARTAVGGDGVARQREVDAEQAAAAPESASRTRRSCLWAERTGCRRRPT